MGLFDTIAAVANPAVIGQGLLGGGLLASPINKDEQGLAQADTNIDPQTLALMKQQSERAGQDEGAYTNQQMQGVGNPQDLVAAQQQIGQGATSLGGGQNTLGNALQARSQRNYGQGVSQLQRHAQLNAPVLQNQQQTLQGKIANENSRVALHNLERQHGIANQMYQARSGIVSQILGGAGAVAGAGSKKRFQGMFNSEQESTPLADNGGFSNMGTSAASSGSDYTDI